MLEIRPISYRKAMDFICREHRHNKKTQCPKFCVSCWNGPQLVGVAVAGNPVARLLNDGLTLEIRRNCTDGTRNACSMLYGACVRIARAMGYRKCITYTLQSEPGASLRASGWVAVAESAGGSWDRPSRPATNMIVNLFGVEEKYSLEPKIRWEIDFATQGKKNG